MKASLARYLAVVAAAVMASSLAQTADALTIHRISGRAGAEELPWPDVASEPGVETVQHYWDEVDDNLFGSLFQLETEGSLVPTSLDPELNLTPLIKERGGRVRINNSYNWYENDDLDLILDDNLETAYQGIGGDQTASQFLKGIWIEFGGLFPIRRVVIQPTPEFINERFLRDYIIGTNDGDTRKLGTREFRHKWRYGFLDFDLIYDVTENRTGLLDLALPDVPIAELMLEVPSGPWEIAELQIFGDGFAAKAGYVSNIIPLEANSSLGDLIWQASVDPGATLEFSVRTGDDTDPNAYWRNTFRGDERSRFDGNGKLLDRAAYGKLEGGEKGGISPDGQSWSFWTAPVDFAAGQAALVGGKPRQFVQISAEFGSTIGSAASRLDFLQFEVSSPPAATQVVAEIIPHHAPLGEITSFTYKLKAEILGDEGFDSIRINTPLAPASVDEVRIGSTVLTRGEFELIPYNGESFGVRFPRVDRNTSGELIEVAFESEVFKVGTVFAGRVFDSEQPFEVRQRVAAGDADPLVEGNSLSVSPSTVSRGAIRAFTVSPLTPNGDGVNDDLEVAYDLVNLAGAVPVELDVFNLAGQRVAEIAVDTGTSGRFSASWDGTDGSDRLLPPGLYLLRLKVEADEETDVAIAPLPLVY